MPEQNFEDDSAHGRAEEKEAARSIEPKVDHGRLARLVAGRFASTARIPTSTQASIQPQAVSVSKKSSAILIALLVGLLLLGGVALGLFFLTRHNRTQTTNSGNVNGNANGIANPDGQSAGPVVKNELIQIPGGTFQMGRNDGVTPESPAHTVNVKSFMMDKTEVTNAEYAEFVKATNHAAPAGWINGLPLGWQEQYPVTNISFDDAKAFADWRSNRDGVQYRLPTEEEWEFAARNGDQDSLYPWGNSWEEGRANLNNTAPKTVGSYPSGQNRWGLMDLIGNAWEWTQSKASLYPGNALVEIPAENKEWIIIRGGSYLSTPVDGKKQITSTYRDWVPQNLKNPALGFRLVRDEK